MDLQGFLIERFTNWSPPAPEVLARTKCTISLDWQRVEPFQFIADQLLYRVEKNDKIPPWFVVYRGGKTSKVIDNLSPRHPHKFRLRVIVKATAVSSLAERAVSYYGDEATVYEKMKPAVKQEEEVNANINENKSEEWLTAHRQEKRAGENANEANPAKNNEDTELKEVGKEVAIKDSRIVKTKPDHKWLESLWSEEAWASTDTDGTSVVCFCMAVRCGYIKQVQGMLDERPDLIGMVNPSNGFTPLATAVRKGDINTVRFLLCAGADVNQRSSTGQTALHIAVLNARIPIVQLLLEQNADFQARDINSLRVEHYSVDSGDVEALRHVLDRGGDVHVEDNNGWTPLFRALCQSAKTEMIEELVVRGSAVEMADRAGLPLTSVARLVVNRHGRSRDSVLRLVDSSYPHEKALANFTRLTKKIYNVHSLLNLPGLQNKKHL